MSDEYDYLQVLHYIGEVSETGNLSNKIWGVVLFNNNYYNFWGKVGKTLSFKYHGNSLNTSNLKIINLIESKINKGYYDVTKNIDSIWPDFTEELLDRYAECRLGDNIRNIN